ncbi:hypothetical protein COOONC_07149, partial [Cooperia oncophora]
MSCHSTNRSINVHLAVVIGVLRSSDGGNRENSMMSHENGLETVPKTSIQEAIIREVEEIDWSVDPTEVR